MYVLMTKINGNYIGRSEYIVDTENVFEDVEDARDMVNALNDDVEYIVAEVIPKFKMYNVKTVVTEVDKL